MVPTVRAADVALRAGVSVTAVSFVVNGNDVGNVAPATRERILAAAEELGYRPNRIAQSLRRQRSHAFGFVTDNIASSPFAGGILAGAVDRALLDDYVVVVVDSHGHADREQAAAAELTSRQVDGLIYATMGLRKLDAVPVSGLPTVLANCYQDPDTMPSVAPDDVAGGALALRHLIGSGHRRVTMLAGHGLRRRGGVETGNISGPLRAKGFRAEARRSGLSAGEATVDVVGWEISDGYHGATRILTGSSGRLLPASERPTAIFAVTDRVATGVLLAAARLGLDVPGDLSLVGFDNQESLAADVVPALTTLALPHQEMGEYAVAGLLDLIHSRTPTTPLRTLLPCPLIERATVALPR